MSYFTSLFFSPVGREYCNWFYFLTITSFLFMVIAGFCTLSMVLSKKVEPLQGFLIFASPFLSYFTNRLLYSMCAGSLDKAHTHPVKEARANSGPADFSGYTTYA